MLNNIMNINISNSFWWHRRSITWIAFVSVLLFTAAMVFSTPEKIDSLFPIYTVFVPAMMGLVGAYFGLKTMERNKIVANSNVEEITEV